MFSPGRVCACVGVDVGCFCAHTIACVRACMIARVCACRPIAIGMPGDVHVARGPEPLRRQPEEVKRTASLANLWSLSKSADLSNLFVSARSTTDLYRRPSIASYSPSTCSCRKSRWFSAKHSHTHHRCNQLNTLANKHGKNTHTHTLTCIGKFGSPFCKYNFAMFVCALSHPFRVHIRRQTPEPTWGGWGKLHFRSKQCAAFHAYLRTSHSRDQSTLFIK